MPTDPDESVPDDPLPEVPMTELIDRLRRLTLPQEEMDVLRGEPIVAMKARGLSWRQIEAQTGIPHGSARRWAQKFLDSK